MTIPSQNMQVRTVLKDVDGLLLEWPLLVKRLPLGRRGGCSHILVFVHLFCGTWLKALQPVCPVTTFHKEKINEAPLVRESRVLASLHELTIRPSNR